MTLKNKLGIQESPELARIEEKITKRKAARSITEHLDICPKTGAKSSKSFSDLLLRVPLRDGEIFSLSGGFV